MKGKPYEVRIFLDDMDAQGIVYHANYLKFMERARAETMEDFGFSVQSQGMGDRRFVVHEIKLTYFRPALLGDLIWVETDWSLSSNYRITFEQVVRKREIKGPLVKATVDVVCIDPEGRLTELPENLVKRFSLQEPLARSKP